MKTDPALIQTKRTRGWGMPVNTVYVGRPSKWGNPFDWKDLLREGKTKEQAREIIVKQYEDWLYSTKAGRQIILDAKRDLKGKNLACWCPVDGPCHGKLLLKIANE